MAITKSIQVGSDTFNFASKTSELTNDSGYITSDAVGNATIIVTQGGVQKGKFTVNQSDDYSFDLDAGGVTGNFVAYDKKQELSEEYQEIARTNIGAGTSSFSGSYNDLTDQPTIPSTTTDMVFTLSDGTTKTISVYTK